MTAGQDQEHRRRILFLNRSYWPDAEATGQLLTELCEDLAEVFEVAVVCGQPNENPGNVEFRRNGMEMHGGVEIHRVFNLQLPKSSFIGRLINFISYMTTSCLRAYSFADRTSSSSKPTRPFSVFWVCCYVGGLVQS